MGLQGLDSPFSCVTPMNMGRNKLVLDFIFEEAVLEGIRGFIVENVEFGAMARADQDVEKLGQGGVVAAARVLIAAVRMALLS
jgi:hypothetical protein